jgi:hypothetical protein
LIKIKSKNMKRLILFFLALCFIFGNPVYSQKGGLLKKVTNSMTNELLGRPEGGRTINNSNQPEPACACDPAELVVGLGGKLQLDYKELTISSLDDGSLLLRNRMGGQYYIVKDGVTQGPLSDQDPRVTQFEPSDNEENSRSKSIDLLIQQNKPYLSRSGDKILITFDGKTYGPYAIVNSFVVSKLKDKFAAIVTPTVVITEAQGKNMDDEIKKAKTEQEKMDLAMKYTMEMQQKMAQGGGAQNITPKLVSNVPNAVSDGMTFMGGNLNNKIKYNEILLVFSDKVTDLEGKVLATFQPGTFGGENFFLKSDNSRYASYTYGTITFSDKVIMTDCFNPYLTKVNGQVYLTYMYYSPKKNAIMQCKILF